MIFIFSKFLRCFVILLLVLTSPRAAVSPKKFLATLMQRESYDHSAPPTLNGSTEVAIGLYIVAIHGIDEQTGSLSATFYLKQSWRDPRLDFQDLFPNVSRVRLHDAPWDQIWIPDLFFTNAMEAEFRDVTVSNRLMYLYATGHVWYTSAIKATFSCPLLLHNYPHDVQNCSIIMESFGYTKDVVVLVWLDKPAIIDHRNHISTHNLYEILLQECFPNYAIGKVPCLSITFMLRRNLGYFVTQCYLPSGLMVTLSWAPLWIEVSMDILMGLLIVLTLLMQTSHSDIPKTNYTTAMDIWFLVCVAHVYMMLALCAVEKVLRKRHLSGKADKLNLAGKVILPVSFGLCSLVYFVNYAVL